LITIKSRRWLDREEFLEVLKIADYIGSENGRAVFRFNFEKALKNNYGYEDVVVLIQEYGLDVDEKELVKIREMYDNIGVVLEWNRFNGFVKLKIPWMIYGRLKDDLRKHHAKYTGRSESEIIYEMTPFNLFEFIEVVYSKGFNVIDKENLLSDKPLMIKPVLKNVELRPYQREAIENWVKNNYKGIIALPTGSGKTLIAIAAIVYKPVRTLIITYTREQMFQWRDMIVKYTDIPVSSIGLIYSEEKRLAPVTITTYQSGFRIINDISPYFNMLIVDEVHHLPADKFRYIALHSLARYRMGLSATPVREDGRHEELFPLLGGIIYYKSPSELVEMGYLAKYKIITVKVKLTEEEYREYLKLRYKYRVYAGTRSFQEVLEDAKKGDETAKEALKIHSQIRMLLARSEAKIRKAVEIARKELEAGSKIIVFTQYVEQARKISEELNAMLLTGETPVDERKSILYRFKEMDKGILVVTTVGDEGLDIPDANVGIIVSGTGSRRQFIQRLGRLLRPKKNGVEAKLYEIVLVKTPEEYQARKRKNIDLDEYL